MVTAWAALHRSPAWSILIGSSFMLSTLLTTWRGRMRSEVSDMQMAFFYEGGGSFSSYLFAMAGHWASPCRATHSCDNWRIIKIFDGCHVQAYLQPLASTPLPFVFVLSPNEVNLFPFAGEMFNHFQLGFFFKLNVLLNSGIAMNRSVTSNPEQQKLFCSICRSVQENLKQIGPEKLKIYIYI